MTDARALDVRCDGHSLIVGLMDGRTIAVPLAWYPRLAHASVEQRAKWELCGGGYGIRWPDLDEDLNTEGLLRAAPAPKGGGVNSLTFSFMALVTTIVWFGTSFLALYAALRLTNLCPRPDMVSPRPGLWFLCSEPVGFLLIAVLHFAASSLVYTVYKVGKNKR